jgi:tripartite-type tricarboxylate transporter receptor subunit TctC
MSGPAATQGKRDLVNGEREVTRRLMLARFARFATVAIALLALAGTGAADDFYKDKKITLLVGSTAGGGYDTDGRLIAKYMPRYIPGHPNIVVSNMPGASGVKAVNYLYANAPRDGTVIGTFNSAMPFLQAVGAPGVTYKSAELSWIGNLSQSVQAVVVWHTAGINTLDDAKKREVIMGALGSGGTMTVFPRLLNAAFGTKFRIVSGYQGGTEVNIAMERGEVHGRGAGVWTTWKRTRPDWVKEGKIIPLLQIGPRKDPDLPHVPLLNDLAQNEEHKQTFLLVAGNIQIERPFAAPPQVPPAQLKILRDAFNRVAKDPEFLAEAEKLETDVAPQTGEETARDVKSILSVPPAIVEKVKVIVGFR